MSKQTYRIPSSVLELPLEMTPQEGGPDPRLRELVKILARRAARQVHRDPLARPVDH
ncbi:hypothetical protein GCM10011273_17790 [Asticcacaulis endophyticus]|uniref:Uncharacterized protein n=1 Tax=Asticcacaulis endophyticus TaxID=1395890 RepID=A0A918Q3D3_9CAUL|nr:hypothetical protein GCM10011273_17790 [Asticcacaulis endophyticus]